jgi:plastocyanin
MHMAGSNRWRWIAVGLAAAILAAAGACGSSSNSTTPAAGGGAAPELNSGSIATTVTFSHTFANAGVFPYHCAIHPTMMTGTVTVNSGGTANDTTITIAASVNFPAVTIQPGHTVHWHNTSGITHTVTSD